MPPQTLPQALCCSPITSQSYDLSHLVISGTLAQAWKRGLSGFLGVARAGLPCPLAVGFALGLIDFIDDQMMLMRIPSVWVLVAAARRCQLWPGSWAAL